MGSEVEGQSRPDADVIEDLETSLQVLMTARAPDDASSPDPSTIEDTVKSLTGERRRIMRALFDRAAAISKLTDLSQPQLLDRIGCKHRTEADLDVLGTDRLQNCARFLDLLADAASSVSTVADRRAAVVMLARLIRQTDQNAQGLAELLEIGDPAPWEYLRLGELSQTARVARLNARSERPEDRDLTPQATSGLSAHVSMPRLDAYLRGEREPFGEAVFERIGEHVRDCRACREAAASRRSRLAV